MKTNDELVWVNIIRQPIRVGDNYEYNIIAYINDEDHSSFNSVFDSVGPIELCYAKAMAKALNNMPKIDEAL